MVPCHEKSGNVWLVLLCMANKIRGNSFGIYVCTHERVCVFVCVNRGQKPERWAESAETCFRDKAQGMERFINIRTALPQCAAWWKSESPVTRVQNCATSPAGSGDGGIPSWEDTPYTDDTRHHEALHTHFRKKKKNPHLFFVFFFFGFTYTYKCMHTQTYTHTQKHRYTI